MPPQAARLIHLNGPPGIGKSTLARRYVADHPGTLNCDVDVLRTLVGGWDEDFALAGALIRPAAIAMISAYLASDHDVVLPQMLVRLGELHKFEAAASGVGASLVEVMLTDTRESAVERFGRRGDDSSDEWHHQVKQIVAEQGGDELLSRYYDGLEELLAARPRTRVVRTKEGCDRRRLPSALGRDWLAGR